MSGTIGPSGSINLGNTQQLDEVGPKDIQGKGKPQDTPGVGLEPAPVSPDPGGSSGVPTNPTPRLDPKTMAENIQDLLAKLKSGENTDIGGLMEQLERVQSELGQQQVKNQTDQIKTNKLKLDSNLQATLGKIQENVQKMEDQKTADTVRKVFAIAGAVLGFIAAIAAVVATGGVAAPAIVGLVVAGLSLTVTVLNESGLSDMFFDAVGASPEVRLGVQLAVAGVLLIGCIVNIGMSIKMAADVVNMTAKAVSIGVNIAQGALKVGEGIDQAVKTQLTLEIAQNEDDKKKIEISNTRIRQMQEDIMKAIRDLMKQLEDGVTTTTQIMSSQSQSTQRQMRSMS